MSTVAPTTTEVRAAWDAVATGFDEHVTPHTLAFGERAVARLELGPGVRVLDVAAGTGALSIPAARRGADVLAVDLSPAMIDRLAARARTEGLANLEARVDDGTALDLDDDRFDVALSMNGVTVFPDLEAGLRELVRVLRPGGEAMIVTFGPLPEVQFVAFFLGALRATAPGALPATGEPPPPFRLAEPAALQRALESAGLREVEVVRDSWETTFDSVDHYLEAVLVSNPIAGQLLSGLDEGQREAFRQVLDGMLREHGGGGSGAVLRSVVNIATGTA